ncbi:MAG: RNA-binding S4 domain-containing protein [Actinomycetota bacterium]|nr:MAG: RNA-binding S4 domain-containing protein [Actinomycetota bacterium]
MADVAVSGPVALGAFLKLAGAAATGGQAKLVIQSGVVTVNGVTERRRGRKVAPGDVVAAGGAEYKVCASSG